MREVHCYHCGYDWSYGGSSDVVAKCPRCKSSVTLRLSDEYQRGARVRPAARVRQPPAYQGRVECPRCEYAWDYRGQNRFNVTCHMCGTTITLERLRSPLEPRPEAASELVLGRPLVTRSS